MGPISRPLSNPPIRGEWGNTNLPFGDYDPRINPQGTYVLFSRLVEDKSSNGNYDSFLTEIDGSNTIPLTHSGHSQGLSIWAPSGEKTLFIITDIDDVGKYALFQMDADGSDVENLTPDYFPPELVCQLRIFHQMKQWFTSSKRGGQKIEHVNYFGVIDVRIVTPA